jgi:hypothetical protein
LVPAAEPRVRSADLLERIIVTDDLTNRVVAWATEIARCAGQLPDKGNDSKCPNGRDITSFTISRTESSPPLSGLLEWSAPTLMEIEYTEELRRLYRCEVVEQAA